MCAFLSEKARVFIFGCRKDANTLAQILPKESFVGILVSDDAAVYQGFTKSQKCWAHLLRKAIRFTLLQPDNEEYKTFLNGLLDVYRAAKRASADQRLKETGRAARVSEHVDTLSALCVSRCKADDVQVKSDDETDHDFNNLVQEVARTDVRLRVVYVRAASGSERNQQRSRTITSRCRSGSTNRSHQQNSSRCSASDDSGQRAGIPQTAPPEFTLSSVQTELQTWWQPAKVCLANC